MMANGRIVSRFPGEASSGQTPTLPTEVSHDQRFHARRVAAPHPQR
jgi:hypothetical protein